MMSKKNKIILIIFETILIITIMILIYLNINNKKIKESLEISKVQTVSNTSNMEVTNYDYEENSHSEQAQNIPLSTSSYTQKNNDNNNNNNYYFNSADLENRCLENVKVEVLKNTVSRTGATIIIVDNNDISFSWNKEVYRIEQKKDNIWKEVTPNKDGFDFSIGYNRDENNKFKFELNWEQDYGSLQNGIYRIVEIATDAKGIIAYSNEFEIND